jgi:pyridoxamine 5'-phosphate oxidase
MADDPTRRFKRWLAEARKRGAPLAESMALATADRRGRPSVRYVLLKQADGRGFVFYTNSRSRKGRDLASNPHASLAVYWDVTGRQIRVDGRVECVSDEEADAYWRSRPRDSRIASLVSSQSAKLASRAELDAEFRAAKKRFADREVPRPSRWVGYVLMPSCIEFWTRREPRLHLRELYEMRDGRWTKSLLQP